MPAGDLLGALADAAQLLARRQAVGGPHRQAHLVAALEPGDPHHVELVEVRGEDRQELGPLEQRQRRVRGQRQHPGVEVEPAQFAVEVAVLGQGGGLGAVGGRRVAAGGASGAAVSPALRRRVDRHPFGVVRSCLARLRSSRPIIPHRPCSSGHRGPTLLRRLFTCSAASARVVAGPTPSSRRGRQVVGGVDVAAQPGHAPVSSTAPESRCRRAESGPNRGSSGTPNANSAAVPCRAGRRRSCAGCARAAAIASASSCGCSAGRSPCSTTISTWSVAQLAASAAASRCSAGRRCLAPVSGRRARVRRASARRRAATSSGVTTVTAATG